MSDVVPADIEIDKDLAKSLIEKFFELKVLNIDTLGEGWDNRVFTVNKELVFRFPRRNIAIPLLERELHLLEKLSYLLPLETPKPKYIVSLKQHKFPFYGHDKLEGITGCRKNLTLEESKAAIIALAKFLKELHSYEYSEVQTEQDMLEAAFDRGDVQRMLKTFACRYESVQRCYDFSAYNKKIVRIYMAVQDYKSQDRCLVHGDLYHRHLIFTKNSKLKGIIDWGDSCVADPVADFGVLYQYFPKEVHGAFWEVYGDISQDKKNYGRFLGLYYAIALLWYGHDRKDSDLIQTSLSTIERI